MEAPKLAGLTRDVPGLQSEVPERSSCVTLYFTAITTLPLARPVST